MGKIDTFVGVRNGVKLKMVVMVTLLKRLIAVVYFRERDLLYKSEGGPKIHFRYCVDMGVQVELPHNTIHMKVSEKLCLLHDGMCTSDKWVMGIHLEA